MNPPEGNGPTPHGVDLPATEAGPAVMHPDHLPTPTSGQRALALLVRVIHFPLLRLVWTLLLFGGLSWALARLAPSIAGLPNVSVGGALRNATLALVVLWVSVRVLEGKSLAQAVGLSVRTGPAGLARGFALGALLLSLVVGVLALVGAYRVDGLGAGAGLRPFGFALFLFTCGAVFEEVIARGILLRLLEQGLGTWVALAISALLFGFGHRGNPGATTLSSVAIALEAGVLLGAAYVATRSLWLPIGMHVAWNLFEGPVFGAAVSGNDLPSVLRARFPGPEWLTGGAFGPEAGVPTMVLGTALGLVFLILAVRRGQVFTPRWLLRLFGRVPPLAPTREPPRPAPVVVPPSV